jgi:hypothetical protein
VPSTEFSKVARDLVFDHAGKYLYASTADGVVQRYNVATGAIDETYEVGGILNGIDIAADDSLLVIAEAVPGLTEGAYHIVDLTTKKTTNAVYTMPDYEFGAWDVTISAKGTALGTTDSWSRSLLREIDLHTRTTNVRTDATNPQNFGYIGGQAPLYRSADGSHVCLIGQSGGFVYNAVTDTFGSHVSWDTGPYQTAAVNRDGTLAAGRFQFDIMAFQLPTLSPTHDMTNFDSPPHGEKSAVSGVVFDPLKDILYAIKTSTDQIVAFDTQTWVEKFRFNIDEAIDPPLDWSTTIRFGVGRVAASSDSRFLALITPLTVRVYDLAAVNKILPAPPPPPVTPIVTISPASRNVSEGGPVEIIISATRYTNRPLTINYSISGTATFGVDYTVSDNLPQSGQIVIPPGHDTVDIWVNTIPDHVTEPTEKMTMTLQPGSGYKFPPVGKSKKKKKPPATALTILDAPY